MFSVPFVRQHILEKVALSTGRSAHHRYDLKDFRKQTQIPALPLNFTSVYQTMNMGKITACKNLYRYTTLYENVQGLATRP